MIQHRFSAFIALVAAAGVYACAEGPTAPAAAPVAASGAPDAAVSVVVAGRLTELQLKAQEESEKRRIFLESERSKRTYDALKVQWDRFLKTGASLTSSPFLMCDPLQYVGEVKIIGPEGGDMSVGPHKLSFPRGAVTQRTVITGEMPVSSEVQVRLHPHGLVFKNQPTLTLSYKHCYRPSGEAKSIVYVNDAMRILEWPLSSDARNDGLVTAKIPHFSGYVVAWSRGRGR